MTENAAVETDPVRKKILAAMRRLMAGKPLRSTGRLGRVSKVILNPVSNRGSVATTE